MVLLLNNLPWVLISLSCRLGLYLIIELCYRLNYVPSGLSGQEPGMWLNEERSHRTFESEPSPAIENTKELEMDGDKIELLSNSVKHYSILVHVYSNLTFRLSLGARKS